MDITATTEPDSTQINADDLLASPRTVTIESVSAGTPEQPVNIHLVETPGRAFRPGKSMRRVLVSAWGPETSAYVGRKMTLFCDPSIKFGPSAVGGIRISHLSHIDKRLTIALTVSRGKRSPFAVDPLVEDAPTSSEPTAEAVTACTDPEVLRGMWQSSGPERRNQIEARVAELATETAK